MSLTMKSPSQSARVEVLLEHAGWLRQLARSLVGEGPRAEDLSQATWVRALEHPPETDRPVRGWLAAVMRNVLRQELRAEKRRTDRERRVYGDSEDREEADALELLSKATMHRELVQAVLELDEPYRRTILLRYFEALTPKRIASKEGIPVSTVKTRLARAHDRLRSVLDGKHDGNRSAWVQALIPVARAPEGLARTLPEISIGALAVNTKLVLAAAVGIAVVGATWIALVNPLAPEPVPEAPALAATSTPTEPDAESDLVDSSTPVEAVSAAGSEERTQVADPRPAAQPSPPGGYTIRGRVIDVEGHPVAGVEVVLSDGRMDDASFAQTPGSPEALAVTLPGGTFEARITSGNALAVRDDRYVTVLGGSPVRTGKETIIVVAPRIDLAGRIVDEAGVGITGATLDFSQPKDLRARLGAVLDYSFEVPFRTASGADGHFRFSAPGIAGGGLRAAAPDYERATEAAPLLSRLDLLFVLERKGTPEGLLEGVVLDARGFPVEGARVSMGIDSRLTKDDGTFAFRFDDPESYNRMAAPYFDVDDGKLIAIKAGHLPAELTAPRFDSEGNPEWPANVVLRLGGPPLSIAGRVTEGSGAPKEGARVWIADPTFFGGLGTSPEGGFPSMTHVETELAGGDPGWHYTETDAEGRFRIEGLQDREYVVRAMDLGNLLRAERSPVRAGDQTVDLIFPSEATYASLRGTVRDGKGNAVENATIFPMCDAFRTRVKGQVIRTRHASVDGVQTDAQGRFELQDVPRDLVYLRVNHPDTIPFEWGRQVEGGLESLVGGDHDDIRITVSRRCHFQVELADTGRADELAMLDAEGNELVISEFLGNGRSEAERHAFHEGKSNPLAVADTATTLVLFQSGEEVERFPVSLDATEPTTLRP